MKKLYASLAIAACAAFSANAQIWVMGDAACTVNDVALTGWVFPGTEVAASADGSYEIIWVTNGANCKMATVGAADWDEFNADAIWFNLQKTEFAGKGDTQKIEILSNNSGDIYAPYAGEWKIVLNKDLTEATVTALSDKTEGFTAVYIRGNMTGSDWPALPEWQFSTEDGINYSFIAKDETMIPAGEQFKIADASWGAYNWGKETDYFPSEDAEVWFKGGDNASLADDFEGTIKLTVLDDGNAEVSWFEGVFESGVESIVIDENAPKTYYNLQGVEVANPANGLYIVKQGDKVSKVVVK